MDCTSESASHYAGCECNEEHWREQLATAVAAREEAERGLAAVIAQRDQHEADVKTACEKLRTLGRVLCNVCADKRAAEAERDQLRERLDKEEEERGRQYGMRVQAETEVERLMSLVQAWYEGRARIGAHMTFADQRFYDGVRCQRTGWPGDDASGDGGPPEES